VPPPEPSDADHGEPAPPVPKLTIGQRVLASLPNLQRDAEAAGGRSTGAKTNNGREDAVVRPDDVIAPDGAPAPRRSWRDAFAAPQGRERAAPSGMTQDELNHVIKRIDDRERVLALWAAVLGVLVGVVLTIAAFHLNPPVHHKNHEAGSVILDYGIARVVLAALVGVAIWKRRRSFVAFALLLLGTAMGNFLFALPFWALALWMIFRVMKWQRELAAMTRGEARARTEGGTSRPTGAARSAAAERAGARPPRGRRAKKPEPAGPTRSKRYTPPRTVRPRPPGS